jgi:hypothetical protein
MSVSRRLPTTATYYVQEYVYADFELLAPSPCQSAVVSRTAELSDV